MFYELGIKTALEKLGQDPFGQLDQALASRRTQMQRMPGIAPMRPAAAGMQPGLQTSKTTPAPAPKPTPTQTGAQSAFGQLNAGLKTMHQQAPGATSMTQTMRQQPQGSQTTTTFRGFRR